MKDAKKIYTPQGTGYKAPSKASLSEDYKSKSQDTSAHMAQVVATAKSMSGSLK